jgi:hypothetical protein
MQPTKNQLKKQAKHAAREARKLQRKAGVEGKEREESGSAPRMTHVHAQAAAARGAAATRAAANGPARAT